MLEIQTWWSMFGLRERRDWNFLGFLIVLAQPIMLYLLAALVLPEFGVEGIVDLRANYYAQSRWFFGLFVFLLLSSIMKDVVLTGSLPNRLNLGAQIIFLIGSGVGMLTRRERFHEFAAPVVILLLAAYIGVLFARLR